MLMDEQSILMTKASKHTINFTLIINSTVETEVYNNEAR